MKIVHAASELLPVCEDGRAGRCRRFAHRPRWPTRAMTCRFLCRLPRRPGAQGPGARRAAPRDCGSRWATGSTPAMCACSPVKKGLTVYFIGREEFFDRRLPYGNGERDYEDNDARFVFFCKAVVEVMRIAEIRADVVHSHDWQAALLPLLVRYEERRSGICARDEDRVHHSQHRVSGNLSDALVCAHQPARRAPRHRRIRILRADQPDEGRHPVRGPGDDRQPALRAGNPDARVRLRAGGRGRNAGG